MKKVFKLGCLGVIGIFALIVIVAVVGGGGDSGESTQTVVTSGEEPKKEEKAPETKTAKVGDTLKVGDVEFKVNEISKATNVGGEFGENSKGEYLVVKVSVANKSKEALLVDSSFFVIKADGKEYKADDMATISANEGADFFFTEINPDLSLDGSVVFDLPKDVHSKDMVLNVQTGLFGTEQGQINLTK